MFISLKNNVIQQVHQSEWQCRRKSKGMSKPEYWTWFETVTTDGVSDFSGETGYTIVECTDENVQERLRQLENYVFNTLDGTTYNIKYYATKRDSEIEGVKSHFIGDDEAKDAQLLAAEWVQIRAERDRLIAETDWMMLSDTGTVSTAWKNYRKALREIPQSQDSVKKYSDIKWPDKPSS